LVPFLIAIFKSLNHGHPQTPPLDPLVLNDLLFGESASTKEVSEGLLKFELFLFCWIVILEQDLQSPLVWWKIHESQFPNVGFLARQIFGIVGSQIEIEHIFSITDVLISL
jgi:hypothetical protein